MKQEETLLSKNDTIKKTGLVNFKRNYNTWFYPITIKKMETRKQRNERPFNQKRDFLIKEKTKELSTLLEIETKTWTTFESISYPQISIKDISSRKNNKLLIDVSIIKNNAKWKYLEINWEKFYELIKGTERKKWNYYYIDNDENQSWVFHIWKITGFEKIYKKDYAERNWQSMRKDWSTNTGKFLTDIE